MQPHREEPQKALPPGAEQRPKHFRIVKLEERIAPSQGKGPTNGNTCGCTAGLYCYVSANCSACCHGATNW
jgi:hypothetical protein